MFRHRLHRTTRPCMRCNRANDDELSCLASLDTNDHKDWQVGVCMGSTISVYQSSRFGRLVNHLSQNVYPSSYFAVIYRPESH